MNKIFLSCCLGFLILMIEPVYGQQYLRLNYDCKKPVAGFARVQVLDHRIKDALIGYVQKGAFNRQEEIDFKGSLADSLAQFFQPAQSAGHGDRELVMILEDLFLSEQTGAFSEDGKLKLSIRLFTKNNEGRFAPLLTIDSTFYTSGLDVTHKMLRSVSERFCALASEADRKMQQAEVTYSFEELNNLDSIEMLRIPVFVNKPQAGIYKTYKSFQANTPDIPAAIGIDTLRNGQFSVYQTAHTHKGKLKKTFVQKSAAVYAVSDGEQLIKYFEDGWYPIFKTGSGFYFDSKTSFSNNAAMWGGAIGGIAGAIVAESIASNKRLYRFRINHRTGKSIPAMIIE